MAIYAGADPILKVYKGSVEVDKVYRRERLVFTRPALPTINRFETAPKFLAAGGSNLPLNFVVQTANATTVTVTDPAGNVIDYTSSPATTAPDDPSTRYTLTAANVEGSVVSHYTFYRTVAPRFTSGLDITYSQVASPTVGVQYRARVAWVVDGTSFPWPSLAWIDPPPSHHLPDPSRATLPSGPGEVNLTFTPGAERLVIPLRLRATNPVSGETAEATGTVTIPSRSG